MGGGGKVDIAGETGKDHSEGVWELFHYVCHASLDL